MSSKTFKQSVFVTSNILRNVENLTPRIRLDYCTPILPQIQTFFKILKFHESCQSKIVIKRYLILETHFSRVGRDTINNSEDMKMKSEMPKSLAGIEKASESLEQASTSLKSDPYSQVMLLETSIN